MIVLDEQLDDPLFFQLIGRWYKGAGHQHQSHATLSDHLGRRRRILVVGIETADIRYNQLYGFLATNSGSFRLLCYLFQIEYRACAGIAEQVARRVANGGVQYQSQTDGQGYLCNGQSGFVLRIT